MSTPDPVLDNSLQTRCNDSLAWCGNMLTARHIACIGLAMAILVFATGWIWPAYTTLIEIRSAALSTSTSEPVARAAANTQGETLHRFYAKFPPDSLILEFTGRINEIADHARLTVVQGDYRQTRDASGLSRYEVTYAVHGDYLALREFIGRCINELPMVSIDALTMSKPNPVEDQIDAQVKLSIFMKHA